MLQFLFCQLSMLDVDPNLIQLEADSFERQLPELLPRLIPREALKGFYSSTATAGAPACCPMQLVAMLLLQFRYDLSERELYVRCLRDLGFRHAIGLEADATPPSARTLRRFRGDLFAAKGDDFLLRLSLRLARDEGLIDDDDLQAIDSTNTDCRGAVVDTYNLVARGIRQVIRSVGQCLETRPDALARRWGMSRYMARSMKGAAEIDWSDEAQRNALLTQEVRDADLVAAKVAELQEQVALPPDVDAAVRLLAVVARQDVEELEDGTFRIAKGTAKGRVISITDPEARHGRKSSSKVINGFKTHAMGTISSQFVTGIAITDASVHDAAPTQDLIKQAERNEVKPREAVADGAYGTGANLRACTELGVALHAKPGRPTSRGAIPKRDFDIDLDEMEVTCPGGQTTRNYTLVKAASGSEERVPTFHFAKADCQQCALKETCCSRTAKGGKRALKLSTHEAELQENRRFCETERGRQVLRDRSSVERLLSHLVRMGMRHARFFTMKKVQLQANMVAAAYNLQRVMTLRAAKQVAEARLAAAG